MVNKSWCARGRVYSVKTRTFVIGSVFLRQLQLDNMAREILAIVHVRAGRRTRV